MIKREELKLENDCNTNDECEQARRDNEPEQLTAQDSAPRDERNQGRKARNMKVSCEYCGKRFQFPATLKQHEQIHFGIKQYECDYCHQRFLHKGTLKCHLRLHTGETPYKCPHCPRAFHGQTALNCHVFKHTRQGAQCPQCFITFATNSIVKQHIKEVHTTERSHICNICGVTYKYRKSLKIHLRNHQKRICPDCGEVFHSVHAMRTHWKKHGAEKLPFMCTFCCRKFAKADELEAHGKLRGRTYQCEMCCHSFNKIQYLGNHNRRSHWKEMGLEQLKVAPPKNGWNRKGVPKPKKANPLDSDSKETEQEKNIEDEQQDVTGNVRAVISGNVCKEGEDLERKAIDETLNQPPPCQLEFVIATNVVAVVQLPNESQQNVGSPFSCEVEQSSHGSVSPVPDLISMDDGFGSDNEASIEENMCITVKAESVSNECGIRDLIPGTSFTDEAKDGYPVATEEKQSSILAEVVEQSQLEKSLSTNGSRSLDCPFCDEKFTVKDDLREHKAAQHPGMKSKAKAYICELCGKSYATSASLAVHRAHHEEYQRFKCKECSRAFVYRCHLEAHTRSAHLNERLVCPLCGKLFKYPQDLKVHSLQHDDEKPFKCDLCPSVFRYPSALRSHKLLHIEGTVFTCNICFKTFRFQNSLRVHKVLHTGVKNFTCEICGRKFATKAPMMRHLATHSVAREIKCIVCQQLFYKKIELVLHQSKEHPDHPLLGKTVKIHVCETCGQEFTKKSNLKSHSYIHEDMYRYKCNLCAVGFKQHAGLRHHIIHFHKLEVPRRKSKSDAICDP